MITKPNYKNAYFLLSVADLKQLPPDEGIEVAIVGRSNAGKSSVLNKLTQNKGLARVSKTPGRTQLINLFALDDKRRLADLPGYGYAKVTKETKAGWQVLLDRYLRERQCLRGLLLVMDIRHPLKEFDQAILRWANDAQLSVHILLNKADKLSLHQLKQTVQKVEQYIQTLNTEVTCQPLSALKGQGIDHLQKKCDTWFSQKN